MFYLSGRIVPKLSKFISTLFQIQAILMTVDPNCNKIGQDLDVPTGLSSASIFNSQLPEPVTVEMVATFLKLAPEMWYKGRGYCGGYRGARCFRINDSGLGCFTPFDC